MGTTPEAAKHLVHGLKQGLQIITRGYCDDQAAEWHATVTGDITPEDRNRFRDSLCSSQMAAASIGKAVGNNPLDFGLPPISRIHDLQRAAEAVRIVNALPVKELDQRMIADAADHLRRYNLIRS